MNAVLSRFPVERNDRGEVVCAVVVTLEANGVAIWCEHRGADPKLVSWHLQTPKTNRAGMLAAAEVHARRIATDAMTEIAMLPRFEQR